MSFIRTEDVPHCPVCQSQGSRCYTRLRDRLHDVPGVWNVRRCGMCELLWLDPRPTPEALNQCYPEQYFTHEAAEPPTFGRHEWKRRLRVTAFRCGLGYGHLPVERWVPSVVGSAAMRIAFLRTKLTAGMGAMLLPYRPGGRLLDVGCGNGRYLAFMKQLGWEVAGVEPDMRAAEVVRTRFGIPVHVGFLDEAPFEARSFDVVTMNHVIEHVLDPVELLRAAAHLLKPGGQLILVTPNTNAFGHRLFRADWYALDPPRHLILFNPPSLKYCLEGTGIFRKTQIRTLPRISRKIYRKRELVLKTGRFCHADEATFYNSRTLRLKTGFFAFGELLGNALLQWGEEVECIATKG